MIENPSKAIFDIECYRDYFLVVFKQLRGGYKAFELFDGHPLDTKSIEPILTYYELIGFNSNTYDTPMLALAMSGANNGTLKSTSDKIITENLKPWDFYRQSGVKEPKWNTVDLIEPAPGVAVSLKTYGGRMHTKKMQDLPIEPDAYISPEDRVELVKYCKNDTIVTEELYLSIEKQINLRREMSVKYGLNLLSKSDAQIAEAVIKKEVEKIIKRKVGKSSIKSSRSFHYDPPEYIKFSSELLNNAFEVVKASEFTAEPSGVIKMSKELETLNITIGKTTYKMGMGGLHSQESEVNYVEDSEHLLRDWDVSSYYPTMISNMSLFPEGMGEAFTQVYKGFITERLEAKRTKNKIVADVLKIFLNGSFGKFGSKYSVLYGPKLLIQTTVTGQLSLFMLIELFESIGISVVSANTDGIVLHCPRTHEAKMRMVIKAWEKRTNLEMECTEYSAIYSRDVNNYVAIKTNGEVKTKGIFSPGGLQKSPTNDICSEAVIAHLKDDMPVEQYVRDCKDIRKFLSVRSVKGGAVKNSKILGKSIRWYYAKGEEGTINYKTNNNKVPRTKGAKPCMDLPHDFPDDVDYDWYVRECNSLLHDIGVTKRPVQIKLPRKNSIIWKSMYEQGLIIEFRDEFIHSADLSWKMLSNE